ncbi:MAG TPA: aminotransferase class III-fold pyridoxal phosphate-dependent enzyme, partial [Bacteroidetes bacterium]|nr:aminotransferase class III-fold pyridoxal phosphate-dependent enzyme [Bacteroidota bacterium]
MSLGEDFRKYVCQTSDSPMGLEVSEARGPWLYTPDGERWLDLISGIGVVNIGHGRDEVLDAIQAQAARYLHTMVYGEFVMEPQVDYARALAQVLPGDIDNIFFTNSGTEAVEGAIKLARKFTGRQDILSFDDCYHGDTMGSLSCQSSDVYRRPFEPLVPGFFSLPWNDVRALEAITDRTAGVIIEPVQGEAGVRIPDDEFMQALRRRTRETGALLIFDEVMTG